MNESSRLSNFSISFFPIALGLSGLALVCVKLAEIYPPLRVAGIALTALALTAFAVISSLYFARLVLYPALVKKEFFHPVKMNFFPVIAKIFLIHSVIFLTFNRKASFVFWILGVIAQTVLMFVILSTWIRHDKFEVHHMNPAWFMPVVGAIMIPIAGVEHGPAELSWFFFAIGVVLWLVLFAMVFYRMVFHSPIAERLLPTLFILFAPPAIGFISYYKLTGSLDAFAQILFNMSLFLLILVLLQFRLFSKIKFYLSWWAYTFPLAALTVALILMSRVSGILFWRYAALGFAVVLAAITVFLIGKTLRSVSRRELCIEEKE